MIDKSLVETAIDNFNMRLDMTKDEIVKLIEPTVDIKFFMYPKMNIKAQEDKKKFF